MDMNEFEPLLVPNKDAAGAFIRCNPRLMDSLRGQAIKNMRSLNAELVGRLAQSLVQEKQEEMA